VLIMVKTLSLLDAPFVLIARTVILMARFAPVGMCWSVIVADCDRKAHSLTSLGIHRTHLSVDR
jgi:hypothetical protein